MHLTEEEAKAKIKEAGLKVRVRSRNGVPLAGDQSSPVNRIDLFITDDVVTRIVGNLPDDESDANQPYGCNDVAACIQECIKDELHLVEKFDDGMCANCGHK